MDPLKDIEWDEEEWDEETQKNWDEKMKLPETYKCKVISEAEYRRLKAQGALN
jgi:hypothetical protein